MIFGALGVVNFAHGACYMLGAVVAAVLLDATGMNFWLALVVVPVLMFGFGVLIERFLVRWLLGLDILYNFLLTFGIALVLVDLVKREYGVSGLPYEQPAGLEGQLQLGAATLPKYQVFVFFFALLVCVVVWLLLTRTRVGMIVRAATEDADRARALGINVGRWVTPVFGFGIALAGLAGARRAVPRHHRRHGRQLHHRPVRNSGDRRTGLDPRRRRRRLRRRDGRGVRAGLRRPLLAVAIFILMAAIILVRPAGLFGRRSRYDVTN